MTFAAWSNPTVHRPWVQIALYATTRPSPSLTRMPGPPGPNANGTWFGTVNGRLLPEPKSATVAMTGPLPAVEGVAAAAVGVAGAAGAVADAEAEAAAAAPGAVAPGVGVGVVDGPCVGGLHGFGGEAAP